MPNIEIKARCRDPRGARAMAGKWATQRIGMDQQIDTYFRSPQGRFKLRESEISGAYLIPYIREEVAGPKCSRYAMIPVADPHEVKTLFGQIFGIDTVVIKKREIYLIDHVRVHLDQVKNLGDFFELEAVYQLPSQEIHERDRVQKLLQAFGIDSTDLIQGSYREMVRPAGGDDSATSQNPSEKIDLPPPQLN